MKHVIWRRDVAYIQRRIPKELRPAFTREGEKQPDIYIKYSLGVTRDAYRQNPRGLEALVAEEYKKHIAWFAQAKRGTFVWDAVREGKPVALIEPIMGGHGARVTLGFEDVPEFEPTVLPAERERLYGQAYLLLTQGKTLTDIRRASRPLPALAPTAAPAGVRLMDDADKSCGELLETYLSQQKIVDDDDVSEFRLAVKRFEEAIGKKPPHAVDELDVAQFYQFLLTLKVDRGARDTVSRGTITKSVSRLRVFFTWLRATRRYATPNPFKGDVALVMPEGGESPAESYTVAELNKIFASPFFTGCVSKARPYTPGPHLIRDGRFWIGIVSLFSGMRLGEIEQLEFQDVVELYGRKFLAINTTSHHGHKKTTKNEPSRRLVPVHETLITMGFLKWVAARRKVARDGLIFPAFGYSKWWNEKLTQHKTVGVWIYRKKTFHSLRHCFEDALNEAAPDAKDGRDRLMGHTIQGMAGNYGTKTGPLGVVYPAGVIRKEYAAIIERIRYDGLKLPTS